MLNLSSLNQRVNALTAKINSIIPIPPPAPDDLQAVLTAGNDSDVSIILKDNLITPSLTTSITSSSIGFNSTSGEVIGSYSGSQYSLLYDGVGSSVGTAGISAVATNVSGTPYSAISGGVTNIPTFPYPASEGNWSINVNSSTRNPQLTLSNSAPFTNSTSMTLDLNNLIHNQATGSPSPDDNFTISTNKNLILTADNIDLSSAGRLIVPSLASTNYIDYNIGKLTIVNDSVGGSANPLLVLQNNSNTAGSVFFETYKNDLPTSTGGDFIGSWSATCNTNIGKTEISRINQIVYGTAGSNNDGGISLACKVNSTINTFLICNGGASTGEIQVFKPITNPTGDITLNTTGSSGTGTITLAPNAGASINIPSEADPTNDYIRINPQTSANSQQLLMTATDAGTGFKNSINLLNSQYRPYLELKAEFGSPIKTLALDVDGAGSSNNKIVAVDSQTNLPLQIDTSGYTNGSIELKVNDTTGDLILTSTNLLSGSAGGNSGQHLRIKVNGVYYKIKLEDD